MDICMFSPFSTKAPSTYRLTSLGRELNRKGYNVSIILPSLDRHSSFVLESNDHIDGIKLIRPYQLSSTNLEVAMIPYLFSSTFKSFLQRCDIVHILKPSPLTCSGYIIKFVYQRPAVQDIDDLDHLVMIAEKHPKMRIWLIKQFEKLIPKMADQIITSSSYLRRIYLDAGIKEGKIAWIPNGVNVLEFDVDFDASLKERYDLKDKVVVYVGSLNNEEQLSSLIQAMHVVVKERNDVSCLIIGDGSARKSLERLTHVLDMELFIKFVGKVDHSDVPKFLSVCDIGFACFPRVNYISASSNIKVFEYMASKLPVIVSPVGDLPYYVDYGRAGIVTDPSNLPDALSDLLQNDRKRRKLGEHGYKYVKDNFDWKVLAEKVEEVYKKASS